MKSENKILFDAIRYLLDDISSETAEYLVLQRLTDYHLNQGQEFNYNFSFDNFIAKMAILKRMESLGYDTKELIKLFPVFGYHSIRPDNFLFFLRCKYPISTSIIWIPLWPIVLLSIIVTVLRVYRKKDWGIEHSTSGVQLIWLKLQCYNSWLDSWIINPLVRMIRGGFKKELLYYNAGNESIYKLIQQKVEE